MACAPAPARLDPDDSADTDAPRVAACPDGPADLAGLAPVPVTIFHLGALQMPDTALTPTFVYDTPVQREWSTFRSWAPPGVDFGNLDADPENAGHGVLLGAWRSSTCGLQALDVAAWSLGDEAGTTYVELTMKDASGGCDQVCEAEGLAGAAVAVPIVDFPFSGPIVGCVDVQPGCE
jgi:hypothetical protein